MFANKVFQYDRGRPGRDLGRLGMEVASNKSGLRLEKCPPPSAIIPQIAFTVRVADPWKMKWRGEGMLTPTGAFLNPPALKGKP